MKSIDSTLKQLRARIFELETWLPLNAPEACAHHAEQIRLSAESLERKVAEEFQVPSNGGSDK